LRTVVAEHLQPVYERLEVARRTQMRAPEVVSA